MHYPALLDIKPSRRLRAALVIVHLLAYAALVAALAEVLPGFWRLLPLPPLVLSLRHGWRSQRVLRIRLERDGRLSWHAGGNDEEICDVLADSTCFSWLIVIRAQCAGGGGESAAPAASQPGRARVAVILADSLPAADFRRLQIWMRWVLPFRRAEGGG